MQSVDRRGILGGIAAAAFAGAAPALGRERGRRYGAVQGLIDRYVAAGRVPGAVVAIVRGGDHRPE